MGRGPGGRQHAGVPRARGGGGPGEAPGGPLRRGPGRVAPRGAEEPLAGEEPLLHRHRRGEGAGGRPGAGLPRGRAPDGRRPDPRAGAGADRRARLVPEPVPPRPDLPRPPGAGGHGRRAGPALGGGGPADHRVRPGAHLPVRRGRARDGDRGGPQRGPPLVPRPPLPGVGHPRAGPRAVPAEPAPDHRRRRLYAGPARPFAPPGHRPPARPDLLVAPERLAGPRRVHEEHGDGGVDVDLDPPRRPALGADLVPPQDAPGGPVRGPDRLRLPRPDALAATGRPGAPRRLRAPDEAEVGAGEAPGLDGQRGQLRRRPGQGLRRAARLRRRGGRGRPLQRPVPPAGDARPTSPTSIGSPTGCPSRPARTSSAPTRWRAPSPRPNPTRTGPAACWRSRSRSSTGATSSGSAPSSCGR